MKECKLTERLSAVAALVPQGARLADIGTDHAYLPIHLLQRGRIEAAFACDLRQGPLERGRAAAEAFAVRGISFRCCDGLRGLQPHEADTIAIAGMGGETIIKILAGVPWSRAPGLRFLLQPMSGIAELRQWLFEAGYRMEADILLREEGRFYHVFSIVPGQDTPYTPAELLAGKQWPGMSSAWREAFLTDLIERRRRALLGMRQGARLGQETVHAAERLLDELINMKESWVSWQQ